MIDLDRLDQGLERAMTDELRTLRGMTPAWARPPEPAAAAAATSSTAPNAPRPAPAPEAWDDDLWEEAGFEPAPPARRAVAPETAEPGTEAAVATPRPPQSRPALRIDVTFEKPARPSATPGAAPRPRPVPRPRAATLRPRPVGAAPPPPQKPRPAPAPAATASVTAPSTAEGHDRVAALVMQGRLAEADAEIAGAGTPMEWRIMRALLDGRRNEACASLRLVTKLGRGDRFWFQRFWVALEWGEAAEQGEVLDHCRERAYRYGELPWRGALTLQLARLGRHDEAARELQTAVGGLDACRDDQTRLDIVTNLIEAAYLLRDAKAAEALGRRLHAAAAKAPFVVVGPAWVCKGSIARFEALAAAAIGQWKLADERFSAAADAHGELGAQALVARTLLEWGHTLLGHDDARARRYIDHGVGVADRLHLTGLANLSRSPALAS